MYFVNVGPDTIFMNSIVTSSVTPALYLKRQPRERRQENKQLLYLGNSKL